MRRSENTFIVDDVFVRKRDLIEIVLLVDYLVINSLPGFQSGFSGEFPATHSQPIKLRSSPVQIG